MKIAIVGTGSRHKMYLDAITDVYKAHHKLVALCDSNPHRLDLTVKAAKAQGVSGVTTYGASDYGRMLNEQKPDAVVISSPDFQHHAHIVAAFEAGCDVICEKPMTIDMPKLADILASRHNTGRTVTVTFNYRYAPARTQIKDILMKGTIGDIVSVDFRWHLDRVHGADYFRRWHRKKANSGGLLVHKATHHFDLLNWWLASTPTEVFATGRRAFYLPGTAIALGLSERGERCSDCAVFEQCDFSLDLNRDPALKNLYRSAESHDGYFRDRCVFDAEIDIEDSMQAHIRFANGVSVNYTLNAYSPWEGLEVKFQGTNGELVHRHVEKHGVFGGSPEALGHESFSTVLHLAGSAPQELSVWDGEGAHGGGDRVMLDYVFDAENQTVDPYDRAADHIMGSWSVLTGIAANRSIESGQAIDIDALLATHGIALARP